MWPPSLQKGSWTNSNVYVNPQKNRGQRTTSCPQIWRGTGAFGRWRKAFAYLRQKLPDWREKTKKLTNSWTLSEAAVKCPGLKPSGCSHPSEVLPPEHHQALAERMVLFLMLDFLISFKGEKA